MSKAKIISVINYKGGVGKTTSAYHIGCSLAQHYHKRVLLIDIDPQTNLTFLCAEYQDSPMRSGLDWMARPFRRNPCSLSLRNWA